MRRSPFLNMHLQRSNSIVLVCVLVLIASAANLVFAQQPVAQEGTTASADPILTIAPHSENAPYWVSGQANSIFQMHGHFHSPYEGANSCLLYTSDAADDLLCVDLGGRRIIKK